MPVCTWNPSDKDAAITLSGGSLTATGSGGAFKSVRATNSQSTGKFYFHIAVTTGGTAFIGGLATAAALLSTNIGGSASGAGVQDNGTTSVNGFVLANAVTLTWATGTRMDFAVDLDAGKAWVGKNGTYSASGNPVTGANPWVTFTPNTVLFPALSLFNAGAASTANFGTTAFTDAAPSGFSAWTNTFYSLTMAQGSYAYAGFAMIQNTGRHLICAFGAYAYQGFATTFPLGTTRVIRAVRFVLQKIRVIAPTLGD